MLYLIATPIGHPDDLSLRAVKVLSEAEVIICEGTKETSKLLKHHQIKARKYELLNEHSKPEDLQTLADLCKTQTVALVTDCGTPGFCDPGADLVRLCHQNNIPYTSLLGPSALMGIISLSGLRLDQFLFRGFLPAENEARAMAWSRLKKTKATQGIAVVILDTPYRLKKTMTELHTHFPDRECVLVLNLSQSDETILKGIPEKIIKNLPFEKAEFMVLIN
ncbi:MAG: methyltransferase [Bdellovibrionales bacterium]|jgi:16S rRNA (cytidine1402-2'-O)-methyltransferase|nr:methyltransferase [Bdellovibrionales bacterium]MBL7671389.1 methyltransferase [Pseudobdellovibrionaceae bacterium]